MKRHTITCSECPTTFTAQRSDKKTCSDYCRYKRMERKRSEKIKHLTEQDKRLTKANKRLTEQDKRLTEANKRLTEVKKIVSKYPPAGTFDQVIHDNYKGAVVSCIECGRDTDCGVEFIVLAFNGEGDNVKVEGAGGYHSGVMCADCWDKLISK